MAVLFAFGVCVLALLLTLFRSARVERWLARLSSAVAPEEAGKVRSVRARVLDCLLCRKGFVDQDDLKLAEGGLKEAAAAATELKQLTTGEKDVDDAASEHDSDSDAGSVVVDHLPPPPPPPTDKELKKRRKAIEEASGAKFAGFTPWLLDRNIDDETGRVLYEDGARLFVNAEVEEDGEDEDPNTQTYIFAAAPTAPAVFVFAGAYDVEPDLMAAAVVLYLVLAAPVMVVSRSSSTQPKSRSRTQSSCCRPSRSPWQSAVSQPSSSSTPGCGTSPAIHSRQRSSRPKASSPFSISWNVRSTARARRRP